MQISSWRVAVVISLSVGPAWGYSVDTSEQPASHPPLAPPDGGEAVTNPPSMVWRVDERAVSYTLELCRSPRFDRGVIRVEKIDMPFYNHSAVLDTGRWHWRYVVVNKAGEVSEPSPTRTFVITDQSVPLPVPPTAEILARMPAHPRVYVTPDTLAAFRARRRATASEAWEDLQYRVHRHLSAALPKLDLRPMPEKPGTRRKKVFYLKDGVPYVPAGYTNRDLNRDAGRANGLSFAYLISGEARYAEAARRWLLFVAPFRMDYHLKDRGQHDTVVYNYEYGLKGVALAFDRLYDLLTAEQRRQVVAHVDYHGDNAYQWCRRRLKLHLNYQNSHGQQCMHALLTTALALATDSERAAEWTDWLVRQYVNRIAWGANDGGYTEGQTYGHKYQYILDALLALATATGVDVFRKPRLRNSGDFWLYCMGLNYWWNHWGDVYSLLLPMVGNWADAYIAGILAAKSGNRALRWYADSVVANPAHVPFWYISATDLKAKPPIDIPQARLFPDVGQLAAYDRFYDHHGNRIFFRSSPWGGTSHAHADQNGFVLHAGGEIMACDAGYYTYYGDTYHRQWSMATQAHNSILVDGKGQPKSITARGRVRGFFNTPEYCVFVGDAAEAYPGMLDRFDRAVLFIRPDVFVVCDELAAPQPALFTWVLNTFEAADIDGSANTMVVEQRDQRLRIQHLAPDELRYSQSNDRPYPLKTRSSCRYTEAFPQQYNIRVVTGKRAERQRILALMHAYSTSSGPRIADASRVDAGDALALSFKAGGIRQTTVFRQRGRDPVAPGPPSGVATDARVVSVARQDDGRLRRWLLHDGRRLSADGVQLFAANARCSAAVRLEGADGAAQIRLQHGPGFEAALWLPARPRTVLRAPPNRPEQARTVAFAWDAGRLAVALAEAGETMLWVDPLRTLSEPPGRLALRLTDSEGAFSVELETAVADNGEIVAFGRLDPRETGVYRLATDAAAVELLVQDRWDPVVSRRGNQQVTAVLREGTELFVRYPPTSEPQVDAVLEESWRGRLVSVLRNGNFEEGIPDYPPRGWTVSHPRTGDLGWPRWSRQEPPQGRACLEFVRPKDRIELISQPMRLGRGGTYVLRFRAKGTATHARVRVSGQRGTTAEVPLRPSEKWQEYRTELEAFPGYCTVSIKFTSGGEADQVAWVDDMQFGYIAP